MGSVATGSRVDLARTVAEVLLRDLPERWAHSAGVADTATRVAVTVDRADRDVLIAAAWLHDIGYSPRLRNVGFHPLDGASYLARNGWSVRICGLVAHHSGALLMARARELERELDRYPSEQSPVSDALTYADQTTGPCGQPMTVDERVIEVLARRGPESTHARVHHQREPHLRAIVARVERRLLVSPGRPALAQP